MQKQYQINFFFLLMCLFSIAAFAQDGFEIGQGNNQLCKQVSSEIIRDPVMSTQQSSIEQLEFLCEDNVLTIQGAVYNQATFNAVSKLAKSKGKTIQIKLEVKVKPR